ncbi:alpha/beta hydrolase, partial [Modestobacter excelsi]|uniref:alpha/beta hydrolase n=1 Tax=Modestobacter excelsi TaxID=2213161 RepID=UPI00110D20A8
SHPTSAPGSGPGHLLRSLTALLCGALAVLASGCGAAPAPAAAPSTVDIPPGGVPGVQVPTIEWSDAGDGFQQATIPVPYDYARPDGRTLGLHLVRLPASDPDHRIGSLFVNFGGPGAPAAALVRAGGRDMFTPEVLARYDLVGVDVRGTGESQPVHCFDDPTQLHELPYVTGPSFPTTPAEETEAIAQAHRLAEVCRARNGDLLDHVGTLPAARDLDVLRAALGDSRINLVGYSYGTFLGQVVANVFPDRVGALVLDGVATPAWAGGRAGGISWLRNHSDEASADTLREFFRLCAEAGPQRCALAADGDPQQALAALADRLRAEPLTVSVAGRPPQQIGYDELVRFTFSAFGIYSPPLWPVLAEFLHAAVTGDTDTVAGILTDLAQFTLPGMEDYSTANIAIACADTDNPADSQRYGQLGRQRDRTVAPYAGSSWAHLALPCASWDGRSTERYTGPWNATTSNPVLLVSTRHDPATPYRNAVRVHDLLPHSALLTVDGVGHGAIDSSSCAKQVTARYLLTGATPPAGTVCPQDRAPFDPPSA